MILTHTSTRARTRRFHLGLGKRPRRAPTTARKRIQMCANTLVVGDPTLHGCPPQLPTKKRPACIQISCTGTLPRSQTACVPRARIGLALVLRWERRSGRRDGQNGGHVDGGDGGGHEWGSACEPRAQTCVSIYVRVDGSMSRDVKRMGGRRRAHLCARRRSCRGRWLPTGRSGPRAPGGVGRGSRRPLWPPRLPASAIAAQPNRRASRNAEKMKPRTRMMTPTMPGAITATRTISSRMYARERRSTQHMSEQSRRRRLWRSRARLRRTPGGSAARSCGPGAPGLPRWTTLSPPRASKSSSAGQGRAPGQRMSRPMRPEVTSEHHARARALGCCPVINSLVG